MLVVAPYLVKVLGFSLAWPEMKLGSQRWNSKTGETWNRKRGFTEGEDVWGFIMEAEKSQLLNELSNI